MIMKAPRLSRPEEDAERGKKRGWRGRG